MCECFHTVLLLFILSSQQADCLSPVNHQGIAILFSSTCHDGQKHQLPCVPPWWVGCSSVGVFMTIDMLSVVRINRYTKTQI